MKSTIDGLFTGGKVDELVSVMETDTYWINRLYAAEALAKLRDPRGWDYLNRSLNSTNPEVREAARGILARLGAPSGAEENYRPISTSMRRRPGCLIAYIVFLVILIALTAILIANNGILALGERNVGGVTTSIVGIPAMIALYFLLIRGLWRLKNWARIIVIVQHSMFMLNILIGIFVEGRITAITAILALIHSAIVYWFASNGKYFTAAKA